MWTLKNIQQTRERNKNKADSHIENKLVVTSGKRDGGRGNTEKEEKELKQSGTVTQRKWNFKDKEIRKKNKAD